MAATPRVLRIEFELRVPPGLRANIHTPRVETAVSALTASVQHLAGSVFPWADRIRVRHSWSYEWWSDAQTLELPGTDRNTVSNTVSPAAGDPAGAVDPTSEGGEDGAGGDSGPGGRTPESA